MLNTEKRNPKTTHIDKMSTLEMVAVIQEENKNAVNAIDTELDSIAKAIDGIAERMAKGGRLFYIGCGTSGRLGVLDASECPPTYGVPHECVVGIIAGGDGALRRASEGTEDNEEFGRRDLSAFELTENDSVVGISVAGGAAYVVGALTYAGEVGAYRVALTCNAGSRIESLADVAIHPDTGAEVVSGSTRMKAGSSHKMILNMISTSVMIKLGHVYENLMINLRPSNIKLERRMIGIVTAICGCDDTRAKELLDANEWNIRRAVDQYKA
jgi:N-acetylmuramic acid 6-phosphate etherase